MAAPAEVAAGSRDALAGLPAPDLTGFTKPDVAFAVEAWPMRAAEELRSALIFRAAARASARCPLTADWTPRFESAVRDEIFHARLCAAVGARLGAERPRFDAAPVRARLAPLVDPLARATSLVLLEVAVGETISMLLFRAARRAAREPLTRAALARILADEVRHQRLGWSALAAWWPELPEPVRGALQETARVGLAAMEQQIAAPAMRRLSSGARFEPSYAALGVLAPEARVEAFYEAVERLVIPRLAKLGLDAEGAWRDRYVKNGTGSFSQL
jgi:hypothetical protein